jgi:hypothetical protein
MPPVDASRQWYEKKPSSVVSSNPSFSTVWVLGLGAYWY